MKIKETEITILITAAGSLNSACPYTLASEDAGFLSIGSTLAIEEIKNQTLQSSGSKCLLAVQNKSKEFFKLKAFDSIEIIEVGSTRHVIQTIENSLRSVRTKWCLINPITSIPTSSIPLVASSYFGEVKIPKENWSSITIDDHGSISFHKKSQKTSEGLSSHPFTGRILAKTKDIIGAIRQINEEEKYDLLNLAENLYKQSKIQVKYELWLDIGHSATYPEARTNSINSRYFNSLEYKKNSNTILKKSNQKEKLLQESTYLRNIPIELKSYFPVLISSKELSNKYEVEMEYISQPSLSEVFLYGNIGLNSWLRIIDSIERIFKLFYEKKPVLIETAEWLYSEKTINRQKKIEKLIQEENLCSLENIYNNSFQVNGICLPSLKTSYSILYRKLLDFEKDRPLHFGHGDLCFNNILVDPIFGNIKLIDPKASIHKTLGICGLSDELYDLAKLNHSFMGLYDCIINNLFSLVEKSDRNFLFQVYRPFFYKEIYSYFQGQLILGKVEKEKLMLLTANLFFSMLPLHAESHSRMLALSIIGSILLNSGDLDFICL